MQIILNVNNHDECKCGMTLGSHGAYPEWEWWFHWRRLLRRWTATWPQPAGGNNKQRSPQGNSERWRISRKSNTSCTPSSSQFRLISAEHHTVNSQIVNNSGLHRIKQKNIPMVGGMTSHDKFSITSISTAVIPSVILKTLLIFTEIVLLFTNYFHLLVLSIFQLAVKLQTMTLSTSCICAKLKVYHKEEGLCPLSRWTAFNVSLTVA